MQQINVKFPDIRVGDYVAMNGGWSLVTGRGDSHLIINNTTRVRYNPVFPDFKVRRPAQ